MGTDLFDLTEEHAAVIGGTGVLGGAMAEALASFGARVSILGRNQDRGMRRVQALESAGGRAIFQAADALHRESLAGAQDAIQKLFGPVSVLVNAAGGNRPDATLPPGS